jgi:bifunctional DNA-binding transcriptional regulator/antitoxin component of YhaV-PrlF toxin-antitoxin module
MNATAIRDRRQTTLPLKVARDAGLKPGDQVEWWVEAGEIRGRKVKPAIIRMTREQCLAAIKRSKLRFKYSYDELRKLTRDDSV